MMSKIRDYANGHSAIKNFGFGIGIAIIIAGAVSAAVFQHEIVQLWDSLVRPDKGSASSSEEPSFNIDASAGRDVNIGEEVTVNNYGGDHVEGNKYEYHFYGYKKSSYEDTLLRYPNFESELASMQDYEYAAEAKFVLDTINSIRVDIDLAEVYTDPFLDLCAVNTANVVPKDGNILAEKFQNDNEKIMTTYLEKYMQGRDRRVLQKMLQVDDFSDSTTQLIIDNLFVPQKNAIEIGIGISKTDTKYSICVYTAIPELLERGSRLELEDFKSNLRNMINSSRIIRGMDLVDYSRTYGDAAQEIAEMWGKNGVPIEQMYIPELGKMQEDYIYSRMALKNVGTYYEYFSSIHIQKVIPRETIDRVLVNDINNFGVGMYFNRDLASYYVVISIQEGAEKDINYTQ